MGRLLGTREKKHKTKRTSSTLGKLPYYLLLPSHYLLSSDTQQPHLCNASHSSSQPFPIHRPFCKNTIVPAAAVCGKCVTGRKSSFSDTRWRASVSQCTAFLDGLDGRHEGGCQFRQILTCLRDISFSWVGVGKEKKYLVYVNKVLKPSYVTYPRLNPTKNHRKNLRPRKFACLAFFWSSWPNAFMGVVMFVGFNTAVIIEVFLTQHNMEASKHPPSHE